MYPQIIVILILLLVIISATLIFIYFNRSSSPTNSMTSSSPTTTYRPKFGDAKNYSNFGITYQDVVKSFTNSIKNLPKNATINSPDLTFPMVLEALKDPKNVIMPDQLVNMTPQQLSSLSDMQLYISNYITSMYLLKNIALTPEQLLLLSPNQILNINLVQGLFGMNEINLMQKNPLTSNQQAAFKRIGL